MGEGPSKDDKRFPCRDDPLAVVVVVVVADVDTDCARAAESWERVLEKALTGFAGWGSSAISHQPC